MCVHAGTGTGVGDYEQGEEEALVLMLLGSLMIFVRMLEPVLMLVVMMAEVKMTIIILQESRSRRGGCEGSPRARI